MNALELLQQPEISELVKKQEEVVRQKAKAGYNLFTISSYTSHLENFHSDVIASLLNPDGLHGEGYTFLHLFIDFLNRSYQIPVDKEKYTNTTVVREKGRIDIWIKDDASRQCIIIENKINDAPDRDSQLKDYFNFAILNGYEVNCILYLSKDGRKLAPMNGSEIDKLVRNIPAFDGTPIDLYDGWLKDLLQKCQTDDSRSVVHQYTKLIFHLGSINMNNEIRERFYQFVNLKENLEAARMVAELNKDLANYRAQRIGTQLTDIRPFGKRWPRYNNYWIFEQFEYCDGRYKLDVWFNDNCDAHVVFWREERQGEAISNQERYEIVRKLLKDIGVSEKFSAESQYWGMAAKFTLSNQYPTLDSIDNAVLDLVKEVLEKLNKLSQNPSL